MAALIVDDWEREEERRKDRFKFLAIQYPEAIAVFDSYYKYHFNFHVVFAGDRWDFAVGEDSDDIYRCVIIPEMPVAAVLRSAVLQYAEIHNKVLGV
jgi:hypothetical protein